MPKLRKKFFRRSISKVLAILFLSVVIPKLKDLPLPYQKQIQYLAFHQNKFPPNLTFFLSAKISSLTVGGMKKILFGKTLKADVALMKQSTIYFSISE